MSTMGNFEDRKCALRIYCRTWPKVFDRAVGSWLYEEGGCAYLDSFTGASALNYGYDNPPIKQAPRSHAQRIAHDNADCATVRRSCASVTSTCRVPRLLRLTDLDQRPRSEPPTVPDRQPRRTGSRQP